VNNRIFAYITVGQQQSDRLTMFAQSNKNGRRKKGEDMSGMSLLYLQDKHTSELFDFLVKNEEFGMRI